MQVLKDRIRTFVRDELFSRGQQQGTLRPAKGPAVLPSYPEAGQRCCHRHSTTRTPRLSNNASSDNTTEVVDLGEPLPAYTAQAPPVRPDQPPSYIRVLLLLRHVPTSDLHSSHTIRPIHLAIPYHLSLDHLKCIRYYMKPSRHPSPIFIPELSCKDTAVSPNGVRYSWSNEIYFNKQTFLQKQEVKCLITRQNGSEEQRFQACPHQIFTVQTLVLRQENAMVWHRNNAPICLGTPLNAQLPKLSKLNACTTCHCDSEWTMEWMGDVLEIRYTCYRDLGPAEDVHNRKWRPLIGGDCDPDRTEEDYRYDTMVKVWHTAKQLGRPGLRDILHETPSGPFNISIAYLAVT